MSKILSLLSNRDYRAIIAFLWTSGTLLITFYIVRFGWTAENCIAMFSTMATINIVIVKGYFDSKEKTEVAPEVKP